MRPPRAALALSVLLVFSGCLGFGGPPPSDPGAEAVVDEAATAASDVETYRFEHDISIVASDGDDTRRLRMDVTGAVNRPNRLLHANTTFRGDVRETYVVGDRAYTECDDPWGWGVENVSEGLGGDWSNADPLGRQIALLQASPVYWAGNETLYGTDVHVVEARPSEDTLREFSDRRRGSVFGPGIEDATLTVYVSTDEKQVLRTVFSFTVSDGGANAEARMTTDVTDRGTNVSISVPNEVSEDPHKLGCPGS